MIDVNRLAPLMNSKVVGDSAEDAGRTISLNELVVYF